MNLHINEALSVPHSDTNPCLLVHCLLQDRAQILWQGIVTSPYFSSLQSHLKGLQSSWVSFPASGPNTCCSLHMFHPWTQLSPRPVPPLGRLGALHSHVLHVTDCSVLLYPNHLGEPGLLTLPPRELLSTTDGDAIKPFEARPRIWMFLIWPPHHWPGHNRREFSRPFRRGWGGCINKYSLNLFLSL